MCAFALSRGVPAPPHTLPTRSSSFSHLGRFGFLLEQRFHLGRRVGRRHDEGQKKERSRRVASTVRRASWLFILTPASERAKNETLTRRRAPASPTIRLLDPGHGRSCLPAPARPPGAGEVQVREREGWKRGEKGAALFLMRRAFFSQPDPPSALLPSPSSLPQSRRPPRLPPGQDLGGPGGGTPWAPGVGKRQRE